MEGYYEKWRKETVKAYENALTLVLALGLTEIPKW